MSKSDPALVLIVDDEPDLCDLLTITLNDMGIRSNSATSIKSAKAFLEKNNYKLCLTDLRIPDGNGIELLQYIRKNHPDTLVAVITAHGTIEVAIDALKKGAFDFITKPVDLEILRNIITTSLKVNANIDANITNIDSILLGNCATMQKLKQNILKLSCSNAPVLITGPSGSGKELVAKLMYEYSPRKDGAFVAVNCGAIPKELMESEFFGHIKGSFTGATNDKQGLIQTANGGILFLDEVAELPLDMQVKLLRVIQEKTVRPIGATEEEKINIRIIAATNKDLSQLVANSTFRQDLYYRINVIEVQVPSLQERLEDIELLINHILNNLVQTHGIDNISIDSAGLEALKNYRFPGNIRELENILERAITMCDNSTITPIDLQLKSQLDCNIGQAAGKINLNGKTLDEYLAEIEETILLQTIAANKNKSSAAKVLGLNLRSLRYRLQKLNIQE